MPAAVNEDGLEIAEPATNPDGLEIVQAARVNEDGLEIARSPHLNADGFEIVNPDAVEDPEHPGYWKDTGLPMLKFTPPEASPEAIERAGDPWYKPKEYTESLLGIGPESVPAGTNTRLPSVTIPLSAAGKTAAGVAGYLTSPQGLAETGLTKTVAAPVVFGKWAYDMLKGAYASASDVKDLLAQKINEAVSGKFIAMNNLPAPVDANQGWTQADSQRLAEDTVNGVVMALGGVGAGKHAVKGAVEFPSYKDPTPNARPPQVEPGRTTDGKVSEFGGIEQEPAERERTDGTEAEITLPSGKAGVENAAPGPNERVNISDKTADNVKGEAEAEKEADQRSGPSVILRKMVGETIAAREDLPASMVAEFNRTAEAPLALPEGNELKGDKYVYTEPSRPLTQEQIWAQERAEASRKMQQVIAERKAAEALSAENAKSEAVQTTGLEAGAGKTKLVQAPEPKHFETVDDLLKFRQIRLAEERSLYKEQIGISDEQSAKLQSLLNRDAETTKFEKTLTPDQLKRFNEFFDGPFNQKDGPWQSWETDVRLNPEEIAHETDTQLLASALVTAVQRGIEEKSNSDRFLSAAIAARRLKELGKTKSDIARYLDSYTTRNSSSQGDKAEFFKELGGKVNAFLKRQGIELPQGDLGRNTTVTERPQLLEDTDGTTPLLDYIEGSVGAGRVKVSSKADFGEYVNQSKAHGKADAVLSLTKGMPADEVLSHLEHVFPRITSEDQLYQAIVKEEAVRRGNKEAAKKIGKIEQEPAERERTEGTERQDATVDRETGAESGDAIEKWFNDAIEATKPGTGWTGSTAMGLAKVPVWLGQEAAHGALRVAKLAYTTTRDLAKAIAVAVEHLRPLRGFNEGEARKWLSDALAERATGQRILASDQISEPAKDAVSEYLYQPRGNVTDQGLADGIVKEFGVDRATEALRDQTLNIPGAVRSKLLGSVTRELASQERAARAKGDAIGAQALAERQGQLWNEMLPRITELAQSLQALRDLVDVSPEGHVARVRGELDRQAQDVIDGRRPEAETIKAAIEQGQKQGIADVKADPAVNAGARAAVDETVANSEETHRAVIMDLAGPWSESPAIVAHAREAVRAKANELLNKQPRPEGFTPSQHLRLILDDLGKRAAGIAASYYQGVATHGGGLAGLLQERLGIEKGQAGRLAASLDREWARMVKEAQGKLPAAIRKARAEGLGLTSSQSAVDAAIRKQLRDLNLKLGDVLKSETERRDQTGEHVAERIVQASGLTGEAADTLRTTLKNRWDALVTAAQTRTLEGMEKASGVTVRGGMKDAFRKLVELNRLGALTSERFYGVVKKALKLKQLTEADAQRLRGLVEKAQQQPEGFLRERSATEVTNFTGKLTGKQHWSDVLMAVVYANILSGITTPAKIILENTNLLVGNTVAELVGHPIRNLLHPAEFGRTLATAYGRGLVKGGLQAESTLRTGTLTGVWERGRSNVLENQPFGNKLEVLNFWKYFTRVIGTAHETTFKPAWEVKQAFLARDVAAREGLSGKALTQRVADLMANTDQAVAEARGQAVQELTGLGRLTPRQPGEAFLKYEKRAVADKLDLARRTREIIEQRREANMPGSTETARDFALRSSYLNEPYGFLGTIATGVRSALERGRADSPVTGTLAKTQIPFTTVVANILNEKLNWTPVGLARAAWSHQTGKLYGREIMDPAERQQLYARAILGTIAMGTLAQLYGDKIHGNGPASPEKRKQMQAAGWIPHSIEWDGRYYSYMNTPTALGLAVIGNWKDWHRYGKGDGADGVSRAAFVAKATANAIVSQGMLDSVKRLFEAVGSESTSQGADRLQKLAARTAGSFVVPNLVQQLDRLWDPTIYDQQGIGALLRSQVPFVRRENQPALNVLGEPVQSDPFHYWTSKQSADPVWRLLADKQAFIPEPSTGAIVGSRKFGVDYYRAITPEEHYDLIRTTGPQIRKQIEDYLPQLQAMPADRAQAMVRMIAEEYHRAAMKKLEPPMPGGK